jgi:glycerol kinase
MTEFLRKFVGSIDQGTTSTRFVIFNHDGDLVAMHQMEHKQHYEKQGWVEHDATEILSNVKEVVRVALAKAGLTKDDLAAVGITNQRETTVVWDKRTGKPYYNAIVWMDTRTRDLCNELSEVCMVVCRVLNIFIYFVNCTSSWLQQHNLNTDI